MTQRVLAIGLDAAERDLVETMAADLPNIRELRRRGLWAPLERDGGAYRAELAHITFLSGRSPTDMGYWGPTHFDPQRYEVRIRQTYLGEPFHLGSGRPTVVFDYPQVPLKDDPDVVQVTAWGAHSAQFPPASRPQGLYDEITRRFGPHPATRTESHVNWHNPRLMVELADALVAGARRRVDIVTWLMARYPDWELFLTAWSETHAAGHQYWHGNDPLHPLHDLPTAGLAAEQLLRVYRAVDEGLGNVLSAAGPATRVIVFSPHGMQPNAGDTVGTVLLPELLFRLQTGRRFFRLADEAGDEWFQLPPTVHPYHYLRRRVDRSQLVHTGRRDRLRHTFVHGLPPAIVEGARRLRATLQERPGPPAWHRVDTRPFREVDLDPATYAEPRLPSGSPASWLRGHWPRMWAFGLPGFSDAHVRINVRGREASGMIDPSDYPAACQRVADVLGEIRDGRTGKPLLAEVTFPRGSDPFDEPGLDADVVAEFNAVTDRIDHPETGPIGPAPYLRPGEHSRRGWALAAGPGVPPGEVSARSPDDLTEMVRRLLDPTSLSLSDLEDTRAT